MSLNLESLFEQVQQAVLLPFLFPSFPGQRIYWLYLLTAFIIAYGVFLHRKNKGKVSEGETVFSYVFPKNIYAHQSTRIDFIFFIINMAFQTLFVFSLFSWVQTNMAIGIENELSVSRVNLQNMLDFGLLGNGVVFTFGTLLAIDFAIFLGHYLQHKLPWLWEFHKTHHTAEVLTPITVYRMHPVDNILTFALVGLLGGTVSGCLQYLLVGDLVIFQVYGLNIGLGLFYLLGYNLRHSHIWLDYGPILSQVFISPAQHQIHHSKLKHHHDKNFGLLFAFWDKGFNCLYIPKGEETIEFGIDTADHDDYQSVWGLFLQPFANLARKFRRQKLFRWQSIISVISVVGVIAVALNMNHSVTAAYKKVNRHVYLENLTWYEVKKAIAQGTTTVIIPTGGTEQNGLHMILGKHNYVIHYTAGRIADRLGKTLVAPVMAYVPEGNINPPEGHMRFAGTLSISEDLFESALEQTAQSLKQHGFKTICLLGDSGGNQASQERVAKKLNKLWENDGAQVIHVGDYYFKNRQVSGLRNQGYSQQVIGSHAGIRDTSELMVAYRRGVKLNQLNPDFKGETGSDGEPLKASPYLGRLLLEQKIIAAIKQIKRDLYKP